MTEWNVVDVFGKRSLYGLRGISVKIHPFVHLSTDVVHGFLVGNARQVIMAILHDHADALFLFPKSFADTDLSTIKNFKVEPLKTEIPIDEPENAKLDFHYPEDYVRN